MGSNVSCCLFGGCVRDIVSGDVANDCDVLLNFYDYDYENEPVNLEQETTRFLSVFSFFAFSIVGYGGKYMVSLYNKCVIKCQAVIGCTVLNFDFVILNSSRPEGPYTPDFDVNGLILLADDSPVKHHVTTVNNMALIDEFMISRCFVPYGWSSDPLTQLGNIKHAHFSHPRNIVNILVRSAAGDYPDSEEKKERIENVLRAIRNKTCTLTSSSVKLCTVNRVLKMANYYITNLAEKMQELYDNAMTDHEELLDHLLIVHTSFVFDLMESCRVLTSHFLELSEE